MNANMPAVTLPPVTPPAAKSGKKYLKYIHHFRGVAILYVMASHVVVDWAPDSLPARVIGVIFQNVTIMFLFIAGYLFQHLSHKFEYKDYLRKKVQNVLSPYLFISAIVITARLLTHSIPQPTLAQHPDFASWSQLEQATYYLFRGSHLQQLWFIPMIALYYLISPVFIYIDRHPRLYYVLIPLYIISMAVPRADLSHTFTMGVHFLSVYIFGMFMSHYKDEYLTFAKKYWVLITLLAPAFLVFTYLASPGIYDAVDFTQKMLFCTFYIYWLWRLEEYMPPFLDVLATLSFGIYFVHYFFVMLLRGASFKLFGHGIPGTVLYWALGLVFVAFAAVYFLKFVKRIAGNKSNYFVGC